MRTKLYGRARPPGESYIFAAMLVKCGRSCQSAHRPVACVHARSTRDSAVSACHCPHCLRAISTEVDISSFATPRGRYAHTQRSAFRSTFFRVPSRCNEEERVRMCSFHFCFIVLRFEKEEEEEETRRWDRFFSWQSIGDIFLLFLLRSIEKKSCKRRFYKFSSPREKEFYKVFWKKNPFGFNPVSRLLFARGVNGSGKEKLLFLRKDKWSYGDIQSGNGF